MIPKIIHNAWFGRGKKADHFKRCMDTWHVIHPDWQYMETNEDTLDPLLASTPYIKGVLERGEFVKATELGRIAALYAYGGIYLDADVEVIKPLDGLLDNEAFIGREDDKHVNGAVMGSQPGNGFLHHLVFGFPAFTDGELPANHYGPLYLTKMLAIWQRQGDGVVTVYPPEFFYPYNWDQKLEDAVITPQTVAIHHWAKSWVKAP